MESVPLLSHLIQDLGKFVVTISGFVFRWGRRGGQLLPGLQNWYPHYGIRRIVTDTVKELMSRFTV